MAGGDVRLRDVTELATRSYVETDLVVRQSRILSVLTRAAAAVVATPTAAELLDTLLGHVLEAVPASRGVVALFEGEPLEVVVAAARATEGEAPWSIDPGGRRARAARARGVPGAARRDAATAASAPCCARRCGSAAPDRAWSAAPAAWCSRGPTGGAPFEEEHLKLVTAVANLAASRLESLELREANADKRRLDEDLRGAARIQHSLLPEATPAVAGFELAGNSRLCSAVGADYYDFVADEGVMLLALGDVAGKGLAAALLMASLRAAVRALWREPLTVSQIMGAVNGNLRQAVPPNRFGTLVLARLELATGFVTWANAGHEAALLVDPNGGHATLDATGTILGVFEDAAWREERVRLPPAACWSCSPTGSSKRPARPRPTSVPSAWRRSCATAGPAASASRILAALQAAVEAGLGGERPSDDHTFVVLRREPALLADPASPGRRASGRWTAARASARSARRPAARRRSRRRAARGARS